MAAKTPVPGAEAFTIHPETRLGHVHYSVADLSRQIAFYQDNLGFKLHWRHGTSAGLGGGGDDLLQLTEVPGARRVRGTTGLYHTAFLVPTRRELAHLLARIAETRTPIQGMTNHGTHDAIYLPDAEGNGIELAWDHPKEVWPKNFAEMMNNRALHPEALVELLAENPSHWDGLSRDTRVGHVHLHVAELAPTAYFYRDILGFEVPWFFTGAPPTFIETVLMFAAGGYHHHIGTNLWQGRGVPPPPADATGLRYFTILLPDEEVLAEVTGRLRQAGLTFEQQDGGILVRDPAGNGVMLAC